MESCPVEGCGREFKDKAGLSGHLRLTHRDDSTKATNSTIQELQKEVTRLSNLVQENNNNGGNKMAKDDFCPECLKKDIDAKEATRTSKEIIDKLNAQLHDTEQRAATAEQAAAKAKDAPDFDAFIEHCQTCGEHKPKLEAYNEKVIKRFVENLTPATIKELAKSKGVDLMPDNIELGPELARRVKT